MATATAAGAYTVGPAPGVTASAAGSYVVGNPPATVVATSGSYVVGAAPATTVPPYLGWGMPLGVLPGSGGSNPGTPDDGTPFTDVFTDSY